MKTFILGGCIIFLLGCEGKIRLKGSADAPKEKYLDVDSNTVATRINVPKGFERMQVDSGSYGAWLRQLPLKDFKEDVKLFDGTNKNTFCHVGVVAMEIGTTDLQQCADSAIRLYAEFLYHQKKYSAIHFNFTNGMNCDYLHYAQGWRILVDGNNTQWYKATGEDFSYKTFRKYLDQVFMYAGSFSLSKELMPVPLEQIMPGDMFVYPGFPGHVEVVMDVCVNNKSDERLFLLAQGFTPAQEIEVLDNLNDSRRSPWYSTEKAHVDSPQMRFENNQLMRFKTQ